MTKKDTQKDKVLTKLVEQGYVDNFWAFHNYILRLGAIIFTLRQDGYKIRTEYKNERGNKNCHYFLEE